MGVAEFSVYFVQEQESRALVEETVAKISEQVDTELHRVEDAVAKISSGVGVPDTDVVKHAVAAAREAALQLLWRLELTGQLPDRSELDLSAVSTTPLFDCGSTSMTLTPPDKKKGTPQDTSVASKGGA